MATRVSPPQYTKEKGYERYKVELLAWNEVTDIVAEKRGIVVALSLPENAEGDIRERVFDEMTTDDLKKVNGLALLIEYLDEQLGKDELTDGLEKFEDFEDYRRQPGQSMSDFISRFDRKYNKIMRLQMKLPSAILAFMLLRKANITKAEKMLVLTGMDYDKKDELYNQAKRSLLKFKGEQGGGGESHVNGATGAMKLEPAYCADDENVWWSAGSNKKSPAQGYRGGPSPVWQRGSQQSGYRGGYSGNFRGYHGNNQSVRNGNQKGADGYSRNFRGYHGNSQSVRNVNAMGADGKTMLCKSCGSFRHLIADCPDSWENRKAVNIAEHDPSSEVVLFTMMPVDSRGNTEDVIMLTGFSKDSVRRFSEEARRCAVLDSACSSTVCGENWMDDYLASLDPVERDKVTSKDSSKVFRFGGGEQLKSMVSFKIPANIVGKEVMITTDVVSSDIPLLLSKAAMKQAGVKVNLQNDTAEILGVEVTLNETSSGHYCIPIDAVGGTTMESVCAVNLDKLSIQNRYKTLMKLHRQFAHPSETRFKRLLEDAGAWRADFQEMVSKIYQSCDVCKLYKKTPPRPVVSMPMASRFNEKVCIDLKKWRDRWILHLVDMWSRFSVSVFINRKRPSDVIDKIMTCWVGAAFGVMEGIVSDNGGEFSSEEMREVCSILNVEKLTTAANSPFQNGLCERNHAVVDNMLLKLEEQCPNTPIVLLGWANMAKNCLQMWHGYSSYQLVFGKNPNLPNIMTEQAPALEGSSTSEMLVQHLNGLHAARRAFIESEADERVRRALRSKIRAAERVYNPGDRIYYKRDCNERWLGPAKVIFQDGKVIFVRHGSTFVRVSANRLTLVTSTGEPGHKEPMEKGVITRGDEFSEPEDCASEEEVVLGQSGIAGDANNASDTSQIGASTDARPIHLKRDDNVRYRVDGSHDWMKAVILGRAGKATGNHKNWYNVRDNEGHKLSLNLAEVADWEKVETEDVNVVIIPKEYHGEEKCRAAKRVELQKLKEFGTYEEVNDTGQFRISTTWVISDKGNQIRARLVARGYEDEQHYPKESPTIGKSAMRVVLAITASKGWDIKTTDIKSAFLQGKEMDRDVHVTPPKEVRINGVIWKLKHCLYGLNDAARHFYKSVVECLQRIGCTQSALDPALFYMLDGKGELIGIVACHVDDFLHSGTAVFDKTVIGKLTDRFLAGKVEGCAFRYVGFNVIQDCMGIIVDHSEYVTKIENGSVDPNRAMDRQDLLVAREQTLFRQLVGRLNWAVQGSRPDLAFDMIDLSTKLKQAAVCDLMRVIKCIERMKSGSSVLKFSILGPYEGWKLVVFTDAALGNLEGSGSVGARICFLVNSSGDSCPLSWGANKIKRVVRSTLAAEMLSLQKGVEDTLYLRGLGTELMGKPGRPIPIVAYVDNKSVVQALGSTKLVDDKRLRIDIASIKECVERNEIAAVRWIRGEDQLANCLTKRGASSNRLMQVLMNGILEF